MTTAVGADGDLGVREFLDLFCAFVALGAFVFVKRHFVGVSLAYSLSKLANFL
jgi:hypothetical protein